MSKNNLIEFEGRAASVDPLSELLQAGAQKLIHQAVEAELYACLEQYADRRTEAGHAGVVRNGYLPEREASAPAIRLNRPLAPSGIEPGAQRAAYHEMACFILEKSVELTPEGVKIT